MSFSKEVKEELSRQVSPARHCRIAEIAAIISLCGNIMINQNDEYCIQIHTENLPVARKCFTLLKKTFNINTEISVKRNKYLRRSKTYILTVKNKKESLRVLQATKLLNEFGEIKENLSVVNNLVVQNTCCKRSFLRGAFLASGSISDPEKTYHFEIALATMPKAVQIKEMLEAFGIEAKIIMRKKYYVVYVKEGSLIVEALAVMEAHVALMNFENVRILKEMRNSINRQVNCETANINKTVVAATKQMEDIIYIKETVGFGELTEGLEEIARVRLEYPEASLKELGSLLNPPIGKSGVNHRLRKLSIIAEQIREQKEEIRHDYQENNH